MAVVLRPDEFPARAIADGVSAVLRDFRFLEDAQLTADEIVTMVDPSEVAGIVYGRTRRAATSRGDHGRERAVPARVADSASMPMSGSLTLVLIAAALGMVIGLLGGGGGILAVPLLIAAGQSYLVASSQSLVIVGAGAAAALVPHHRARRVEWPIGLTFGVLGAAGAAVGALLAPALSPDLLLGGLIILLFAGAVAMFRATLRERPPSDEATADNERLAEATAVPAVRESAVGSAGGAGRLRLVGLASSVGLVTGLLGVGAGFVVVPALVSAVKLPIKKATATALVVIVINSVVAATVRHGSQASLAVTAGMAVASATFAVVGALASRRVPAWILSAAFGSLMVIVAVYTVVHSLTSR